MFRDAGSGKNPEEPICLEDFGGIGRHLQFERNSSSPKKDVIFILRNIGRLHIAKQRGYNLFPIHSDLSVGFEYIPTSRAVSSASEFEEVRAALIHNWMSYKEAVQRAGENDEIQLLQNAGGGYVSWTDADQKRFEKTALIATGIFFVTNEIPMMLSPYSMRNTQPTFEYPGLYKRPSL